MRSNEDTYDLVTSAWIPVIGADGKTFRVGLAAFAERAGSLRALAGSPPVRIAVLRLIVAVLRDALGHDAVAEERWRAWWEDRSLPVGTMTAYLDEHADRFRLYDPERPFLQDPVMHGDRTAVRSVAELAPHLPTGNNATLIHRTTDLGGPNPACFSAADAACWLVSLHAHARPGITVSRNAAAPGRLSGRAGPLLGRLAAVPECDTAARTVLLNLPRAARDPLDIPTYLADQAVRSGKYACGPVSLLTWTSRHVLLLPEADGTLKAVKVAVDDDIDPLVSRQALAEHDPHLLAAASVKSPDGWILAPATAGRTPLGDTAVISRYAASPAPGSVLPAGAAAAAENQAVRLTIYGLAVESSAKFTDWTVSSIPCVSHGSIVSATRTAQIAADAAGDAAAAFVRMSSTPWNSRSTRGAVMRARAVAAVWQRLDAPGRALLALLTSRCASETEEATWRRQCARAAHAAVEETTQRREYTEAGARVAARLARTLAAATAETSPQ
jgi:hypothetical protein